MKHVYIETMGCQMNKSDTERMLGMLSHFDYEETKDPEKADLLMVNTCSIRQLSEDKAFSQLGVWGKWKQDKNPDLKIGMCGCVAQQKARQVFSRAPYVDFVLGTHKIYSLPDVIKRINNGERVCECEETNLPSQNPENYEINRVKSTNAWINITEGCNNFCTYCIVPYTRGRERSRLPETIIKEVKDALNAGFKEITLLGQNVNSYGKTLEDNVTFAELLSEIAKVDGLERIRFMTPHPKDLSDELIEVIRDNPKVCNHIHLPLQSGSSRLLKLMNRQYTKEHYLELVDKIRKTIPDISITTDIIVGFPGETEEDFEDTLDVVSKVHFEQVYMFIYSRRVGTPADKMENQVPDEVKHERFDRLKKLAESQIAGNNQKYVNTIQKVLVEGKSKTNETMLTGRTETNKVVNFEGTDDMIGKIINLKIVSEHMWYLKGEV